MRMRAFLLLSLFAFINAILGADPNGYVIYCPCMGRFGNQAEQLLGSLAFAKALNRTLVLPHWIVHASYPAHTVPFDYFIAVGPLESYHRVILMRDFMYLVAPGIWPFGERVAFCHGARDGSTSNDCNAKEGNPFGPFWDTFSISFDRSEFYAPLTADDRSAAAWTQRYPASRYPVIALVGAPGSFPARPEHVLLSKYIEWSDDIEDRSTAFADNYLTRPYLALHLRNGVDQQRACELIKDQRANDHPTEPPARRQLFSSYQCLGHNNENGYVYHEMCLPETSVVLSQIERLLISQPAIRSIFVGADDDDLLEAIQSRLRDSTILRNRHIKVVRYFSDDPQVDLAVMARADEFIGNCVSSFSAFATRMRNVHGRKSRFWAFPPNELVAESASFDARRAREAARKLDL